jgi:hypothetical protein
VAVLVGVDEYERGSIDRLFGGIEADGEQARAEAERRIGEFAHGVGRVIVVAQVGLDGIPWRGVSLEREEHIQRTWAAMDL